MLISFYLMQSRYTKKLKKIIPSINQRAIEIFCVPLYTDYLSDLHNKKFQLTSRYEYRINEMYIKFLIWTLWNSLFLSYADSRNAQTKH